MALPPIPLGAGFDENSWIFFMEQVRQQLNVLYTNLGVVNSRATDPSIIDIPRGQSALWKNTTSGLVKLWTNDGGALKSVTLT